MTSRFLYKLRVAYLLFTNCVALIGIGLISNMIHLRLETPRSMAVMAESGIESETNEEIGSYHSEIALNGQNRPSEETVIGANRSNQGSDAAASQNDRELAQVSSESSPTPEIVPSPTQTSSAGLLLEPNAPSPTQPISSTELAPTIVFQSVQEPVQTQSPDPTAVLVPATATATSTPAPTLPPTATPWPSEPGVLSVPKINLLQQVQHVPIRDGNWDIGNLGEEVGLLQATGRHPNDHLSMAFVGHVTTVWPIGGPFERIGHLSLGDVVQYQVGPQLFVYEITRFLRVDPSRGDLLINERGDQILLVTCDGYSLLTDQFSERLIAQATLVRTEMVEMPDEIGQ